MHDQPTLTAEYLGSYALRINDETFDYSRNHGSGGVLPRLCRELIRRGYSPQETIRVMRNATKVYVNDDPLGFWAAISIEEGISRSIRRAKYRPMPGLVSAVLPRKARTAILQPKVA